MALFARNRNRMISSFNNRYFSCFENYSKTSKNYDKTRTAVGSDQLESTLFSLYKNKYEPLSSYYTDSRYCDNKKYDEFLSELRVLDVGCGTGNYLIHLKALGVGSITGLELNEGMMNQCKSKLKYNKNCLVQLYNNSMIDMPFKSLSFDVIMINQALHHIDNDETRNNNYQNIRKTLSNCYDKLNHNDNGSVLFITTSYPSQCKNAYWYYPFFPSCLKLIDEKFNEFNWWRDNLIDIGFKNVQQTIITDTCMTKEAYYNFQGIFDEEWRNGDSSFSVVYGDELVSGQQEIQKIINDKTETRLFIDKYENLRQEFGHSAAIVAYK